MDEFSPLPGQEARLEYFSGDYRIIQRGDFVRCAVTGVAIPLEDLRYWSFETQEAFATPQAMLERHKTIVPGSPA